MTALCGKWDYTQIIPSLISQEVKQKLYNNIAFMKHSENHLAKKKKKLEFQAETLKRKNSVLA